MRHAKDETLPSNLLPCLPSHTDDILRRGDELEVRANSSLLSRANDSYLRQKIAFRFLREPALKDTDLQIVVEDSVAFLMGLTNTEQAEVAAHEASLTGGIRRVVKVFEYVE